MSVNISSRQIFRQNLIQEIRHILGRNIVPKGSLRLEITESLVMENPEQATEILEWLRGAGAELALDDFGTGYSSLAYLQRLPFDTIKIDRSLVQASGESGGAGSAIVRSIVALGHELGKSVVAEGVGDAGGRRLPALDQLRVRARFLLRRADVGSRRAAALEDGAHRRAQAAPRGLFRTKTKGKQRDKGLAAAAKTNGATPPGQPHAEHARPPGPPATLPNSTFVRARFNRRQPVWQQLLAQRVAAAAPAHAAGRLVPDDFAMPPPPPPMPGMSEQHQSMPLNAHEFSTPQHDFAPPPPPFDGPAHHAFQGSRRGLRSRRGRPNRRH